MNTYQTAAVKFDRKSVLILVDLWLILDFALSFTMEFA